MTDKSDNNPNRPNVSSISDEEFVDLLDQLYQEEGDTGEYQESYDKVHGALKEELYPKSKKKPKYLNYMSYMSIAALFLVGFFFLVPREEPVVTHKSGSSRSVAVSITALELSGNLIDLHLSTSKSSYASVFLKAGDEPPRLVAGPIELLTDGPTKVSFQKGFKITSEVSIKVCAVAGKNKDDIEILNKGINLFWDSLPSGSCKIVASN